MKKFLLIGTLCMVYFVSNGQSNVVKINIFSPLVKTFNASYERVLSSSSSFQLGIAYTSFGIEDTKTKGIRVTPEYRFYLSDSDAPEGFYAAPFIRYSNLTLTHDNIDAEAEFSAFGGGLVFGKQWIFKDKIGLEVFLGPSYSSGSIKVKSEGDSADTFSTGPLDGFGVRFGVNFGIAF